ncbi:hypothetical protein U1Q18_004438, partial [Sarracenia purpurea var. burkii]
PDSTLPRMLPPPSLTAGATTPSTVAHDGSHDVVHCQIPYTSEIWNITAEATKPTLPPLTPPLETMEAMPMEARFGETSVPVSVATTMEATLLSDLATEIAIPI